MPPLEKESATGLAVYDWDEICKHDKEDDAWVVKDGEVWECLASPRPRHCTQVCIMPSPHASIVHERVAFCTMPALSAAPAWSATCLPRV